MDPYRHGLALAARGALAEAIDSFERALVRAPDDVRVLFALGNAARDLDMPQPAEMFFRRVLRADPARIEALVNLVNLLRAQGRFDAAYALLAPALQDNPQSHELWLTLGGLHRETGADGDAERCFERVLALKPDCVAALVNRADLLADKGNADEAFALYDRALKHGADPQARLNRAVLHLLQGNLAQGWRDYEARLRLRGKVPMANHGLRRWDGKLRKGLVLMVTAEQGIGDQIMFASQIPELAEQARVILECEPRLVTLFQRSFPTVTVHAWDAQTTVGTARTRFGWLKALGGANAAIEMGSVAKFLRPALERFRRPHSYLVPDAAETARWRGVFGPGPAIGLCWRSGKLGGGRAVQFAPLAAWAKFARGLDDTIVSVQYDATPDEIAELTVLSGKEVVVPQGLDQKHEIDRSCAMLSALDAVVSAPTAVSWLAAAADVPTCKIVRDSSWTSFGCDFEPFAPACTVAAPKIRGDWDDAFSRALSLLGARSAPHA
ncbi:MAG: tetratricopeptide repeat protein [Alphaproteobacteria bacterium]|nr:tetratricopeptide repeat protein [Alphaproteobacteria bacterium]